MKEGVIILGGGLAGASAACRLRDKDIPVTLVEKEAEPHHKVCGEFLSFEAQHYLKLCGLDLKGLGAVSLDQLRLHTQHDSVTLPLGFEAVSLSRKVLDAALLDSAEKRGAQILRGCVASGLTNHQRRFEIQTVKPVAWPSAAARADAVFLASGKHDFRGISERKAHRAPYIGFKMHFVLSEEQQREVAAAVEIFLFRGGYVGIEPIEKGGANLCLVVTKARFAASGKNWTRLLDALKRELPQLAGRLAGARALFNRPLAVFQIPYGFVYRPASDDGANIFRLGDQMAVIPSLCGDGMAIALHSGFLSADHYVTGNAKSYHAAARAVFRPQIRKASLVATGLAMPLVHKALIPLARRMPKLIARFIEETRVKELID